MLIQPLYDVGGIKQPMAVGDQINTRERTIAVDGTSSFTFAAADFAGGDLIVGSGAGVTGTLMSADQLVKALMGSLFASPSSSPFHSYSTSFVPELGMNMQPIPPQSSFRRTIINNNTGTLTLAAPSSAGVTISGTGTIATVNWREYIVRILDGSPMVIIPLTTTNASKNLTNVDKGLIRAVRAGMSVYGTGIGASAKVDSVNYDSGTIHVDVNSSATADNIAVTFTPTIVLQTLRGGNINN